jgi:hypothetical protein
MTTTTLLPVLQPAQYGRQQGHRSAAIEAYAFRYVAVRRGYPARRVMRTQLGDIFSRLR